MYVAADCLTAKIIARLKSRERPLRVTGYLRGDLIAGMPTTMRAIIVFIL
jgi:hypothetical protein